MSSVDEPVYVPAPDLPVGPRNALVIATADYADVKLRQLRSPVKDAECLAAVLADPAIGGFKVTQLVDQTESRLRREIAAFLLDRGADETVLMYLSCHGIQDKRGRLLFAATDTDTDLPHASAIRAAELLDELDECAALRQILILDCCFSGSFGDAKGGHHGELDLERQLRRHSRGREVLTASRGFEYSFEGQPLGDAIVGSVFTTGLVEGLRTGAADIDKDGHVTVEEAYGYAFGYVQRDGSPQTPQRWLFRGEGSKIVMARSVAGREVVPAKLSEQIVAALENGSPYVRIGGVNALGEWLAGSDPARALAARRALTEVADSDIRRVAEIASAHLEQVKPSEAEVPAPSQARVNTRLREDWIPGAGSSAIESRVNVTHCMAFSPDGKLLATGSDVGSVWVYEVATGNETYNVNVRWSAVSCVAFSPDGKLLASAGKRKTVRVSDALTGKELRILAGHAGAVRGVAFSPDGRLLASASEDGTVRIWQVATGAELRVLAGHTGVVFDVAFSPDGTLIASASADGTVRMWEAATATGTGWRALEGHAGEVHGVAFSPDGTLIASASADGTVRVWEAVTGKWLRTFDGHSGIVRDVAFSPDGRLLASACGDETVRVWAAATGTELPSIQGHMLLAWCVAFSPTEPLLASAGVGWTIQFWR